MNNNNFAVGQQNNHPQQTYAQPQAYAQQAYAQVQPPCYAVSAAPAYRQVLLPIPQPYSSYSRKLFRKHSTRVGLMLLANMAIMTGVFALVYYGAYFALMMLSENSLFEIDYRYTPLLYVFYMIASIASALAANLIPSSMHAHKWKIKFTEPFKGKRLSAGFVTLAAITAIGLNFIWGYIYSIIGALFDSSYYTVDTSDTSYTAASLWLMVIWTCVVAPITEEYMFRGVILRVLSKYGQWFGIVMSSLLFGLWHGNLAQAPMAFLVGLIMGYVATKSGNIRQSIAIHAINNTFVTLSEVIIFYFPEWYEVVNVVYFVLEILAMLFSVAMLIYFSVVRSQGKKMRALRLSQLYKSGGAVQAPVSRQEMRFAALELPNEGGVPEFVYVKHKFLHFVTSAGIIVFLLYSVYAILGSMAMI